MTGRRGLIEDVLELPGMKKGISEGLGAMFDRRTGQRRLARKGVAS